MFSFRKIMIVMLAALILGGGMISMSMHAMEVLQEVALQQDQPVEQNPPVVEQDQQPDVQTILANHQAAQERRRAEREAQERAQQMRDTLKSVGKNAAAFLAVALVVTTAVRWGAKAVYEGFHAPVFIDGVPQCVQQEAHKHGDHVAHELSIASFLGVLGCYVAKWLS